MAIRLVTFSPGRTGAAPCSAGPSGRSENVGGQAEKLYSPD